MSQQSIAQRMRMLGCSLENAAPEPIVPEEQPPIVDSASTDVMDTLALTDAQSGVDEAESVLERLQEDHSELSEVASALESFLAQPGDLSPFLVQALAIPARRVTQPYGLTNSIPSMESVGESPAAVRTALRASLEATDSRLEQLGTWIKEVFKSLLEKISALWEQLTDRFGALKKKAQAVLESVRASAEEKSDNITVPVAIARRLVVEGQIPKDLRQPMDRLSALVGGQLQETSDELIHAHEENLKDAEQLVEDVKHKLPGFAKSNLDEYTEKTKARLANFMQQTERARAEAWIATEGSAEVTKTKPLMGNEQLELVPGLFSIKCNVLTDGDFPSEPVEIPRIAPDVCEELLNSVVEICDVVAKYSSSAANRKELYKKTEKVAWAIAFKQNEALFNQQFIREFSLGLLGFVQSAKALAGPTTAHAFRSCSAIVSVCEMSAKA